MNDNSEGKEATSRNIAFETLERYCGSDPKLFRSNLLITNFPPYVDYFAKERGIQVYEGAMFKVAHSEKDDVSILDFKIGSPAAALVVDLCSFLPIKSSLFLGMCGGLRRRYNVGEYLVPVASIRGEGTSGHYFPPSVPALANFLMQKAVTDILEREKLIYHVGITYTTDIRFWEFNEDFSENLKMTRAQGIDMECAALFIASYKRRFTLGALLLISDLPLKRDGIKTRKSSQFIFENYMPKHIDLGIKVLKRASELQDKSVKGAYNKHDMDEKEGSL